MKYKSRIHYLGVLILLLGFTMTGFGQEHIKTDSLLYKKYNYPVGHLRFKNIGLAFSGIMDTSVQSDTIYFFNAWDQIMKFQFKDLPEHITCYVIPDSLLPEQEGKLVVTYDAQTLGEYGRIVDYFFFYTNEPDMPKKRVIISPDIKEDFSSLTEEEKNNTPIIEFGETTFNFDSITEGETITHNYPFTNTGKRPLIIRSARGSCGCTKAEIPTKEFEPGENGEIMVIFDSRRKRGAQKYSVAVISNDVNNPKVNLEISGFVIEKESRWIKEDKSKKTEGSEQ